LSGSVAPTLRSIKEAWSDLSPDPALDLKGHRLTEDNEEAIAELMRVGLTREQAKDLILEGCWPPPTTTKRKTTNC
jgi:hypothetical protein